MKVRFLMILLLAGCMPAPAPAPKPSASPTISAAVQLSFEAKACSQAMTVSQESDSGIRQTWLPDGSLQIQAGASANCAVRVESGRYELRGKQLKLFYTAQACGVAGAPTCVRCVCDHPVTYTLRNLPRADYEVSLEEDKPK